MTTKIEHVVDCAHLAHSALALPALRISNDQGPIVDILHNADVVIHQEGNIPEAAQRLYAELRRIGSLPMPSVTEEFITELSRKISVEVGDNASVAPNLVFPYVYLNLKDVLLYGKDIGPAEVING